MPVTFKLPCNRTEYKTLNRIDCDSSSGGYMILFPRGWGCASPKKSLSLMRNGRRKEHHNFRCPFSADAVFCKKRGIMFPQFFWKANTSHIPSGGGGADRGLRGFGILKWARAGCAPLKSTTHLLTPKITDKQQRSFDISRCLLVEKVRGGGRHG